MSSDSDAPHSEGGDKTERMDRLRALLTKPIKIPASASTDGEDADYAAPVAAAAAPKGAKTPMTPKAPTPKGSTTKAPPGAKAPVETPPAVKAAAEALDRLTEEEKEAVVDDAATPGKPNKARRTWADAYLAKPDKPLTPEEVRAELTVALKEQGAELRELVTKQGIAQEKSLENAQERTATELTSRFEEKLTSLESSTEQVVAGTRTETTRLQNRIDELTSTTETLRGDLDAARTVADAARTAAESATTAASAARETADLATKKAATATTFAWVGIALALVAAAVAVLM